MARPENNISAETAVELLKEGQILTDFYISGVIDLTHAEYWEHPISISNCIVESFIGINVEFKKQVIFDNCEFQNCQFTFTYFLGGLIIESCTFKNYLDFNAGGHNKKGHPVVIKNSHFIEFVNFFDCWYVDKVTICDNHFDQGTNLLGTTHNMSVTFDIEPVISGNLGKLDHDHE